MNPNHSLDRFLTSQPDRRVACVGVGSAGCKVVSELDRTGTQIDSFCYISCDEADVSLSPDGPKLLLDARLYKRESPSIVRGLGEGQFDAICALLKGSRLVFVVSGLGGIVGSGLASVVASAAKDVGAICVGIAIMPFRFERNKHFFAATSLKQLRRSSDAVVIVDNTEFLDQEPQKPIIELYAELNERISYALNRITEVCGEKDLGVELSKLVAAVNEGYTVLTIRSSQSINKAEEVVVEAARSVCHVARIDEASRAVLYLIGDETLSANEVATSVGRLGGVLGHGSLQVDYGFSVRGVSGLTAVLLASGFKTTKFDDYDPLASILREREIDDAPDSSIDVELPALTLLNC